MSGSQRLTTASSSSPETSNTRDLQCKLASAGNADQLEPNNNHVLTPSLLPNKETTLCKTPSPIDSSLLSSSRNTSVNSSFKELKKNYELKKKCFTKSIQSAIESTQEVHSGWLKARTTFKNWTKVWCQVKPGYLILYNSQEAQKKHRLGVILLSVCQVIIRPTKKDGFCFKLINPFDSSVWAKYSTRALTFPAATLTLRASDPSIGKLWLDSLRQCNLALNLDGYDAIIDGTASVSSRENLAHHQCNQSLMSESEDGDVSIRNLVIGKPAMNGTTLSINNSVSSLNDHHSNSGRVSTTGMSMGSKLGNLGSHLSLHESERNILKSNSIRGSIRDLKSSHLENYNNNLAARSTTNQQPAIVPANLSSPSNKMVAKFSKYSWRELKLEAVSYVVDGAEELGSVGMQAEEVQEGNKNFLWHIIKQLRPGMDLSKVTLPTFILEPRSFLEKLADYYYHCDLLTEAVLTEDPLYRLINIVKWYLSGFYKKPKGPKKPYNPILGERFRCFWDHPKTQSRTFFVAEQVSHHPPISAFHVSNRKDGFTITCALLSRSKYGGNSVSAILDGKAKLYLNRRGETYTITMPYANCRGILLGSLCMELGGKVEIECKESNCKCELDFKLAPTVFANANSYNSLTGKILRNGKVTHLLDGHWDKKIQITDKRNGDQKSTLWEVTDSVKSSRLKRYTVSVKDQQERESVNLWKKVTEALMLNDQTTATAEKTKLEDMQRQEARDRRGTFIPEHFRLSDGANEWFYRWQDDRVWNVNRDIVQFEDNFKIRTLMMSPKSTNNGEQVSPVDPVIDMPLTQLNRFADSGEQELKQSNTDEVSKPATDHHESNPLKSIETKFIAENRLIRQAIEKVNEKNRRLEEDLATLKRSKRAAALMVATIIVVLLSAYLRYW